MTEFRTFSLGEVCSRLSSGKGISASKINQNDKYPVFGGNGLRGYTSQANFSGECAIIGRQGAFCGNVRYFSGEAYMTEHAVVVCATQNHNTRYLAYLLSTMNLGRLSVQSAQPGLSVKTLAQQLINLPELEIQNKVVSVLASLDEKIEANNKVNDNLQQLVHLLYSQLISELTDDCKLPLISAEVCRVLSPKITKYDGEKIYIATADVTEHSITNKTTKLDYDSRPSRANMQPISWSLWFAKMKASPKFIFINDSCPELVDECIFSTGFYGLKADRDMFYYLWAFISSSEFDKTKDAYCSGTTMQALNNDGLAKITVYMPSPEALKTFSDRVEPIFNLIHTNTIENERLSLLRDSLMQKLLSGEVEVSDI